MTRERAEDAKKKIAKSFNKVLKAKASKKAASDTNDDGSATDETENEPAVSDGDL